jgi:hypothetical protein
MKYWANEWRNIGGPNVLPMNDKIPVLKEYAHLLDKPIDQRLHDFWIEHGWFKNGVAIVNGRCWHNKYKINLWIHTIDCDSESATKIILEIFHVQTLEDLSKLGLVVEVHKGTPTKCHVIIYSNQEFPNLASNASGIEIKGSGKLTTVTPTLNQEYVCFT